MYWTTIHNDNSNNNNDKLEERSLCLSLAAAPVARPSSRRRGCRRRRRYHRRCGVSSGGGGGSDSSSSGRLVLWRRYVGYLARNVVIGKARPAAQAGVARPALEARLPELAARREHAVALAVNAHLAVAVGLTQAVRLTGHVHYSSWRWKFIT